jgi:hypothetical protein
MTTDLSRKRPAEVLRAAPIPPSRVRRVTDLTAPSMAMLRAELKRRTLSGEVEKAWNMRMITEGRMAGRFAVRVVLVPPRPHRAREGVRRALLAVGAALGGLASLVASLAWLLTALTGPALLAFLGTVLIVFGALVWAKYGRRRTEVSVTTTTTVHVR